MNSQQQQHMTLPSALNSLDSAQLQKQLASLAASPDKDSPKTCVWKLRGQTNDMKDTKTDNAKGHTDHMDAMTKTNLAKRDARQAQYDGESDAQRHRNADNKAINAKSVNDLSTANESKVTAMRVANEAEIVEMRRQGAEGNAEHNAWMHRIQTQNAQRMAKMESDGARNLSAMKLQDRGDELRHKNDFAGMNTAHAVDMASTEQKHQNELTQSRWIKADNLTQHNHQMTAMGAQYRHETDDQKQRQRNDVNVQGRANDAKEATETANMTELKGKNQNAMDEMCRLMRSTEELEAAVEASTQRFFVLADKVRDQRTVIRSHVELQKSTQTLLSTQMEHIRSMRTDVKNSNTGKKCTEAAQTETMGSLKELRKRSKVIISEQESLRRRVTRQLNAFEKVNDKLLDKHTF